LRWPSFSTGSSVVRIALLQEERYIPSYHGSNKSNRALLEALARFGHDCKALCTVLPRDAASDAFLDEMRRRGIDVRSTSPDLLSFQHNGVQVCGMPRSGGAAERGKFLAAGLAEFCPDIVLVSSSALSYHLESAMAIAPASTIYLAHGHHDLPFGPSAQALDQGRASLIRRTAAVVTVSGYGVDYLREHGGIDAELLRFPVYGEGPFPVLGSFDRGAVTLIRSSVTKGVSIFIALAVTFSGHAFAASTWGAAPDDLASLRGMANVTVFEPAEDIETLLARTKLLVVPSVLPETFGLIVPEAMARGIPVIASDLGGLREATLSVGQPLPVRPARFEDGVYICPPQDLARWIDELGLLLKDRAAYDRRSRESQVAAAHFIAPISVRPFEDLFLSIRRRRARKRIPAVAVVDPYDAGYLLVEELQRRDRAVVGVVSNERIDPEIRAKCISSGLNGLVQHRNDVEETILSLRSHDIGIVLAGCETGVRLADELSERMRLMSNGTLLSAARRHKFFMAEQVRRHGLSVPLQHYSSRLDDLLDWVCDHGRWPVVVKPPQSLASEDVRLCRTDEELASAFVQTVGRYNIAGVVNEGLIVQEVMDAPQFVVDTVSYEGRHSLSGIWRYGRPPFASEFLAALAHGGAWPRSVGHLGWRSLAYGAISSVSKEIVAGEGEVAEELLRYAFQALDALGIRYGPAHFELMWTDVGVRLVEVGARVHGAPQTHLVNRLCTGVSQVDQTVDMLLNPVQFLRQARQSYSLRWRAIMVRLKVWQAGVFRGLCGFERITRLDSFHASFAMSRPGVQVPACVGVVILLHTDADAIARDYQAIRQLEKQDLYEIAVCSHDEGGT
jgi:biotin carboxylase/glycosyltransferase involved in cell wall biosynthesis